MWKGKDHTNKNQNQRKEVFIMEYVYYIYMQKGDEPSNDDHIYSKIKATPFRAAKEIEYLNKSDKFGIRYYMINATIAEQRGFTL